jgi:hypothetical protein
LKVRYGQAFLELDAPGGRESSDHTVIIPSQNNKVFTVFRVLQFSQQDSTHVIHNRDAPTGAIDIERLTAFGSNPKVAEIRFKPPFFQNKFALLPQFC